MKRSRMSVMSARKVSRQSWISPRRRYSTLSPPAAEAATMPIRQVVMNALEKIENAAKTSGTVTGIPTGFIDLDYRTAGLQPSDLILIAARPSMGKTAFVLNIAQYVAFHENMCTAIFRSRCPRSSLSIVCFWSPEWMRRRSVLVISDADWEKLIEGAGTIGNSELIIDDTPGISISEMRSKCRKYKLEHDLKLVIIDYLQAHVRFREVYRLPSAGDFGYFPIPQGTRKRAFRAGNCTLPASRAVEQRRITARCFPICVSPEPSSRMPTW